MRLIYLSILLSLFSLNAMGLNQLDNALASDVKAYCQYITEKNTAKRKLLLAPDLIVRLQDSDNELLSQNNLIAALSKDLSDLAKAKYVKQLIADECRYYQLREEAKLQIAFAIPQIQRQALHYKLKQIQTAKNKLQGLLKKIQNKIDNHNDTMNNYYRVDALLQRLEDEQQTIHITLATQEPPRMAHVKLNQLLGQVWDAQKNRQATLNKLEKQSHWALQLQTGAQQYLSSNQNVNPYQNKAVQPYVGVFLRYNLGSIASHKQMDRSLTHYMNWKNKQVNGIQEQLSKLKIAIASLKAAEQQRLNKLTQHYKKYFGFTKKLNSVDSIKALRFKQQIETDRIMMAIEISYVQCLIDLLEKII